MEYIQSSDKIEIQIHAIYHYYELSDLKRDQPTAVAEFIERMQHVLVVAFEHVTPVNTQGE
jgi:hypothetical protein